MDVGEVVMRECSRMDVGINISLQLKIIEIGQPLNEEQVYDANRPMLKSLLEEQKHVKVIDFGICPDRFY